MTDRPTPIKAIRRRCLDCSGCSVADVRDCGIPDCALHPYRMGHRPKPPAPKTPIRSIRAYCLDCCADSAVEVKLCPKADCGLHIYRLGHNPAREGIRHAGSFVSARQLATAGQGTADRPEACCSDGTPQTDTSGQLDND